MRKIKLLKPWLNHNKGDLVLVDNNVAFGLIDNKTATYDITIQKPFEDKKVTKESRFGKKRSYHIK